MGTKNQAELDRLRRRRDSAQERLLDAVAELCPGPHLPVQHRDHKPRWCRRCGRTADGIPVAKRDEER